jgi:hypothetical protein
MGLLDELDVLVMGLAFLAHPVVEVVLELLDGPEELPNSLIVGGLQPVDGLFVLAIQPGCALSNTPPALLFDLPLVGLAVAVVLRLSLRKLLLPLAVILHILTLLELQFLP